MIEERRSWKRKLARSLLIIVLVVVAGHVALKFWMMKAWKSWVHDSLTPRVYTFSSTAEIEKEQKGWLEGQLGVEFPKWTEFLKLDTLG